MRAKILIAALGGALGAVAVLALLVTALVRDSASFAWAAAVLGVLVIVFGGIMLALVARRARRSANRSSTRITNLERRLTELRDRPNPVVTTPPGVVSSMPDAETERPLRIVVVAMKPRLLGRIRRNIQTFLDLGAEVIVVNSTPREDFFQGLQHPRLFADFITVRSLAVQYQARMTRQMQARSAERSRRKGTDAVGTRREQIEQRLEPTLQSVRKRRDLTVRDSLKTFHLVNRFFEFWRLSPDHVARHNPDLVVSSDLPGLVGASRAARRLGRPHLHDCHELYLESTALKAHEKRVLRPFEQKYMRRADSVVVVNQTIRDEYLDRYGVVGKVLRNCAPAVPDAVRKNPVDLQSEIGIPSTHRVVLYQGGLVAGRGLDVCIRAVPYFPADAHLVLIGAGRMQEELESLAEELGVSARVHFLGEVPPADLPPYTAGASVGLIPYQPVSRNNEYALPNKVFEYTGAGIPFVAADLPEIRRIVDSTGCGAVYDPFDPRGLAARVRMVTDPTSYPEAKARAEEFGRSNTWENEKQVLIGEVTRLTRRA